MNVQITPVDATSIVPTLSIATSVPATLVMKFKMITEHALVRISTYVCMLGTDNA